jgi:hypothetical protein
MGQGLAEPVPSASRLIGGDFAHDIAHDEVCPPPQSRQLLQLEEDEESESTDSGGVGVRCFGGHLNFATFIKNVGCHF